MTFLQELTKPRNLTHGRGAIQLETVLIFAVSISTAPAHSINLRPESTWFAGEGKYYEVNGQCGFDFGWFHTFRGNFRKQNSQKD